MRAIFLIKELPFETVLLIFHFQARKPPGLFIASLKPLFSRDHDLRIANFFPET